MFKLGSILSGKFGRKDELSKQLHIVKILDAYRAEIKKLFPSETAIEPISLKDKVLTVSVPSSVVASELRLHEMPILEILGRDQVERVVYRF